MSDEHTCAVWYYRYGRADYDTFDSETDAATSAYYMSVAGAAAVVGVQYADGSFVKRDEWAMYHAESERLMEDGRRWAAERAAAPKPPMRAIRVPWGNETIEVGVDEPSWLGTPVEG